MLDIGKALKEQRENINLSQSQLAKLTGLPQQTISWSEKNNGYPKIDFLIQLADFYGITLDELIGREIQPITKPLIPTKENIKQIIHDNHGTINNKF